MNCNAKSLSCLAVSAALLLTWVEAKARVLDDFNDGVKTGWTDFTFIPGWGLPEEADGQFKFNLSPIPNSIFTASTMTTETFTLKDERTLELRVDMVSGNGKDAFGVLAFIPTTSTASTLAGYGLAKSSTDILVSKGVNKYFYNENMPVKNENVTLVLSLTGQGTSVIIHTSILDKENNNAVLWERTFVDTEAADLLSDGTDDPAAAYTGAGNVVLYCYEDNADGNTQASYEVSFDNLEAFEMDNLVLDNFDDDTKTGWEDFSPAPPLGIPEEANGQFQFVWPAAGQIIFSGSTKTSRTFDFKDGERLVFSVDLVSGNGPDAFAAVGYFPSAGSISTLAGYGLVVSSRDFILSKGIYKYFYDNDGITLKNNNVKLVLSLEGRGTSVVVNGKVLDNDNNGAVLWERTFVDTDGADLLASGTDDPAAPYMGTGYFALLCVEDKGTTQPTYEVTFDNAAVSIPPPPANTAPLISGVQPEPFANFLPASARITFDVADDKPLANNGITVALNGVVYGTNNGLSVTGSGVTRSVSLGGLSENVNYAAVLQVVDSDQVTNAVSLYFDTFSPDDLIIEVEDYNFSAGQYVDAPTPVPETVFDPLGYRYQTGVAAVDYSDTETSFPNGPYRPSDAVAMQRSLDIARQKFIDMGGSAMGYYDYDVGEIRTGEWLNYTRTFLDGTYEVYLREAIYNLAQGECVLERVTGDPSQPDPATEVLGSFLGSATGFRYRNFPLTDASGQQIITVQLSGAQTLRLRQVTPDPSDGGIYQNYILFLPAAGAGVQRPLVSHLTPAPGATVQTVSPAIDITILNRETVLEPLSIVLEVNGSPVQPEVLSDPTGAVITYAMTPLPAPNTPNTARLVFADDQGVSQTNTWSFTIAYKHLDPLQARPGVGSNPGFLLRMVQAPAGSDLENSLARAEAQLAPNSVYPAVMDTNTIVPVVNFNQNPPSPAYISVPGLYDENGFTLGNGTDDFSVELLTYLDLPAGAYRFAAQTDDGYKISSGTELRDLTVPPLAGRNGSANETFDFVVTQSGLYPFRMVWYERGGDASAQWSSVNILTGEKTLINDPNAPDAIKAYTEAPAPLSLESAELLAGPYSIEASAVVDPAARTITVPIQGSPRFFRLRAATALHLTGIQVRDGIATLTYE